MIDNTAALRWYAARTSTRREPAAAESLKALGFETYFPQEVRQNLDGKSIERPLVVGYVMFRATEDAAGALSEQLSNPQDGDDLPEGVSSLVRYRCASGQLKPHPIPPSDIARLRALVDMGEFDWTKRKGFEPIVGQAVTVTKGQFAGWDGTVFAVNRDTKRLTISMRIGAMELSVDHVEAWSLKRRDAASCAQR